MKYNLVAVGGTFDRLHKGHESLLTTAFQLGRNVRIGITSDEMVQKKTLSVAIDSFDDRKQAVVAYLKNKGWDNRATITKLTDPYGPLRETKEIEALVVGPKFTREVVENVKNNIDIVQCPTAYEDTGHFLSSTNIRRGRVSRDGVSYRLSNKTLTLPDFLRPKLKQPLDTLIEEKKDIPNFLQNHRKSAMLITVGDETTHWFLANGTIPQLSIVDFHIGRKKVFSSMKDLGFKENMLVTTVLNPAGILTPVLAKSIRRAIMRIMKSGKPEVVRVRGEEDLAVLPVILSAPLSSLVWYGQPPLRSGQVNKGLVAVEVTEEKKKEIVTLLSQFTPT